MISFAAAMNQPPVEQCIESLCLKGCKEVLHLIGEIEQGRLPAEVAHLSETERQAVLKELKAIMAVYQRKAL
jgi:hypothetical protein